MRQLIWILTALFFLGLPLTSSVVVAEEAAAEAPVKKFSKKEVKASKQFARQLMEYKFLSSGERKRYLRRHPQFAKMLKRKKGALKRLQESLVVKVAPKEEGGDEGSPEAEEDEADDEAEEVSEEDEGDEGEDSEEESEEEEGDEEDEYEDEDEEEAEE